MPWVILARAELAVGCVLVLFGVVDKVHWQAVLYLVSLSFSNMISSLF